LLVEGIQTTALPGTLGLNPMVRSLETTYDGGKMMSGYGWFSGTVTTGWLVKLFGTFACGGTDAVSVPTGYNTIALGLASTAATCLTTTHWIWSSLNLETANYWDRSTLVVTAAEAWKNGTLKKTAAAGEDPMNVAAGGISARATFGLGVWNMMVWTTDYLGISNTTGAGGTYGNTFVDATDTGYNGLTITHMLLATNFGVTGPDDGGLNINMQHNCYTSVTQYTKIQKTTYTNKGEFILGGYATSSVGCLDYVTDEMNISGIYHLMIFDDTLTVSSTATVQTPTLSIKPVAAPTATSQYVAPTEPLDNATGNLIFSYNFGVLKQVEDVNGKNNTTSSAMSCLVLFSAPE